MVSEQALQELKLKVAEQYLTLQKKLEAGALYPYKEYTHDFFIFVSDFYKEYGLGIPENSRRKWDHYFTQIFHDFDRLHRQYELAEEKITENLELVLWKGLPALAPLPGEKVLFLLPNGIREIKEYHLNLEDEYFSRIIFFRSPDEEEKTNQATAFSGEVYSVEYSPELPLRETVIPLAGQKYTEMLRKKLYPEH